ncbi:MAG: aminotransferase class V-fold PLP-dependent enzyme [Eubacterium sp.]|nr:aminotransferase class V-fold PLP-dependent enzyme [Eubacterium sp.]
MIYLNNAATSYPKPQCVQKAYAAALAALPAGQFRSGAGNDGDDSFNLCKKNLGKLLGIADTQRIYFTSGATESLNLLIRGCRRRASQFVTTAQDHNSVLRPLFNLTPGEEPKILPCDTFGLVHPKDLEQLLAHNRQSRENPLKVLILSHCSNVTGAVQNIRDLSRIAKKYGLLVILDVSQSAGCLEVRADAWGIDALAFTGHKSLLGVQGTGGMYIRRGAPVFPVKFGGTGRDSSRLTYPLAAASPDSPPGSLPYSLPDSLSGSLPYSLPYSLPDSLSGSLSDSPMDPDLADTYEYETGTGNGPGIAALAAATGWVLEKRLSAITEKEYACIRTLYENLGTIPGVKLYGDPKHNHGPVMSFNIQGMKASDVSYILQNSYGIVTRCGLHCAPLIHGHIGSGRDGTVRISVSWFTDESDLNALLHAVSELSAAVS